jgi:two-component system alkaline phosphatase synthesis response regulator PhoP
MSGGEAEAWPPFHSPTMALVKMILLVDDEPRIVQLVRDYLEHSGFGVLTATDGPTALRTASTQHPDLIVLDLGLPGIDGLDVMRTLRKTSEVPIIVLTARGEESDRVAGLELGADDYLTKPFSPKELVARVRSVLRRADGMKAPADVIRVGYDVELKVPSMEVRIGGRRIDVTATEFQLLATMARQPGRIFTRAQLLNAVHGVAFESYERAIDAHIKNMRRKIEPDPQNPRYLQTVFGVGYRFADPQQ